MFIYMNERIFDRFVNIKDKLQFDKINIDETELCEMKNRLLQEETIIMIMTSVSKRSTSQTIMSDASRP
jgi:hypothetical protein